MLNHCAIIRDDIHCSIAFVFIIILYIENMFNLCFLSSRFCFYSFFFAFVFNFYSSLHFIFVFKVKLLKFVFAIDTNPLHDFLLPLIIINSLSTFFIISSENLTFKRIIIFFSMFYHFGFFLLFFLLFILFSL